MLPSNLIASLQSKSCLPTKVLRLTSFRLRGLQSVLKTFGFSNLEKAKQVELSILLTGCRNVLEMLKKELESFNSLGGTSKDTGERWQRFIYRFKWDEKRISNIRAQIVSNITVLNAFSLDHIG